MEATLIEGGIGRLQNPTFLFQLSELVRVVEIGSLWTWGAVVLAAIAAFGSLIRKARFIILRFRIAQPSISHSLVSDDDVDEDDTCSSCSSSDYSEAGELSEEEEVDEVDDEWRWGRTDLMLAEVASGRDVVKGWDDGRVDRELRFENEFSDLVSLWDRGRDEVVRLFSAAAVCIAPPDVTLSAGKETDDIRVWDARVGRQTPAMMLEKPSGLRRRVLGMGARAEDKVVYLHDAAESASVVDLRNPNWVMRRVSATEAAAAAE